MPAESPSTTPEPSPARSARGVVAARRGGLAGRLPRLSRRQAIRWLLPLPAVALLGAVLGAAFAATIHIPEVDAITEYSPGLITQLYDSRGGVYRQYYRESRVMLEEGEVPEVLQNALLAMEDASFYRHGGVDAMGVVRAALRNVFQGRREGASTLTMQLAGTLFLDRTQREGLAGWERKIAEAFRAVELEKTLSKQQILTLYANVMNLGHGNYGFESAARFYYDKGVDELTLPEAATLVAIIKRPSEWSPIRRPEFMTTRRNLVLRRMLDEGFITAGQFAEAAAQPLAIAPRRRDRRPGSYFAEAVRRELYERYGEAGLYERGLQVTTTVEPRIQTAAEEALRWGLVRIDQTVHGWRGPHSHLDEPDLESARLPSWTTDDLAPGDWIEGLVLSVERSMATVKVGDRRFEIGPGQIAWTRRRRPGEILKPGDVAWFTVHLDEEADSVEPAADDAALPPPAPLRLELVQEPMLEGAVVVLDSASGAVRALVGGWSEERNEFNRAIQAMRQPGSAFKPFVYGAAYEAGYTPADTLFDAPAVFIGGDQRASYSPRNFYREYNGILTLRRGLEKSINVTAVKLQDLVGVDKVIDFARRAGVQSPLPPYPSLALGVAELTPLELTAAYAAIANQGIWVEPHLVERVETPGGRVIEQHQPNTSQAMEPPIAYLLIHTLRGVVRHGTATELASLPVPIAGKTGTTDGFTDAWFVGFTPQLSIGVWVGFDQKRRIGRNMTGAVAAIPIWKRLAEQGLAAGWLADSGDFVPPPGIVFRRVDYATGLLATAASQETLDEAFLLGTEPVLEYTPHWARVLELPWYQQRAFYGKPKDGENMPEDIEDWSLVQRDDERRTGG
ncbi:MAG TPA: PBP1A family penicillin-binding protein [Thermoanaerobaculia bacterium]|nr:PBP1A family penicillin-binding protein [Thermoanaerobaculia bacterium]